MRYRISVAALAMACAAVVVGLQTATAGSGHAPGTKNNGLSICEEQYLTAYKHAHAKFGSGAVGANVVDDGMGKHEPYNLPEDTTCAKADVLKTMLHPPPAPEPVEVASSDVAYSDTAPAPVASGSGSCTPLPGEASSPYDVNPTSGAAGCYQVIPSTAAAMGSACADVNAPSCLAAICAAQGNSAWSASGATPC